MTIADVVVAFDAATVLQLFSILFNCSLLVIEVQQGNVYCIVPVF